MRMSVHHALAHLGLTWSDGANPGAICKAWKHKLRLAHPDKSTSLNATEHTQRLNLAKEVLLERFEDPETTQRRRAEEERAAKERERQRAEETQRELEKRASDIQDNAQWLQRERYARNRRKRAPSARVHRRIEEYEQGKGLVDDMRSFFSNRFIEKNEHVLMSHIAQLFFEERTATSKDTSELERRLFRRHARRIMASTWPHARYTKHKKRWSFYGIAPDGK